MHEFKKTERVVLSHDFALVKKMGVRVRGRLVFASFLAVSNRKRLGIVVSRKIGNAVERNRLKRVIREFFRCNKEIFSEGDIVFIPTKRASEKNNAEIRADLLKVIEKLKK